MYFRKMFTGTKGSESSKTMIRRLSRTDNIGCYYNYTLLINNAIVDTLTAAGIDASFNNSTMVLTIMGIHIQLISSGSFAGGSWEVYDCSGDTRYVVSSSGNVGNYTTYNFAVTLIGDSTGILNIFIGVSNAPMDITGGISLCKITELRTKEKLLGVGRAYNYSYSIFNETCTRHIASDTFVDFFSGNAADLMIPMRENIGRLGLYKMDNTYTTNNSAILYKNFYNIEGELYYSPYNGWLTKITE